ncbi:MAG: tRNA uridine-5-carboxymethylaminomethyl(34) synthesis enzyme MnmG, partial [Eubacteriales bacterium]|nr:tRNA uridine-5-carboxymethylaminomethyl(34) synthesis enzyme MnmG [Eubacteriales bacterium]
LNEINRLKNLIISPSDKVNEFLQKNNSVKINNGISLYELCKRPELSYELLKEIDDNRPILHKDEITQVSIEIKYEGYIKRQRMQVESFKKMEKKIIPQNINYDDIKNLRLEARQKLKKIMPENLGKASRIAGVSPADISVLMIYLKS